MRRIALSLTSLIFVALGSIAHAQIPNVPDAARYAAYSVTSATTNFDVPFALYGDCTDLTVKVAGVAQPSGWTCNSKGGQPLANIARPVTDAQIVFTTAVSNALVEVSGAWHPRWSMGTAPGITRAEFNRNLGTVLSKQRELFDQASLFAAGRMPVGIGAPSSGVGATGDYYLDISTANVYGPKTSTSWPSAALFSLAQPVQINPPNSAVTINITDEIFAGETTINNALTRADAALSGLVGGVVRFPAQSGCYSKTVTHVTNNSNIAYLFDPGACVNDTSTGDYFVVGNGTNNPHNVAFLNATINPGGSPTGAAIRFRNTYNATASNIVCGGTQNVCIDVDGGSNQYQTHIDRVQCFAGQSCIRLGNAGGQASETWVTNSLPGGQNVAGLEAISAGGLYTSNNSFLGNVRSIFAHPGTGQQVSGWFSDGDILDTQQSIALLLDGTSGIVSQTRFSNTWAATCGTTAPYLHDPCIRILGSTTNVRSISFRNLLQFAGRGNGFELNGGRDIDIDGQITANSFGSGSGTYSGLVVAAGVSNWSYNGRSGIQTNVASNDQNYGVVVAAGGSDYYRITGEFSNNVTGDVSDGGTGTHKYVNTTGGLFVWKGVNSALLGNTSNAVHTFTGTSRDSSFGTPGSGIFNITTGTGLSTDEGFRCGVHDGDYSWCQASKPGTAARNLALNPSGGNVGIGNTNPLVALHVTGAIRSSSAPIWDALTGYVKANGTSPATASSTIPISDLTGGPLAATLGGTGQSVFTVGDLLYASTTTVISKLADVATGNVLRSGGVGVAPAWGKINLSTDLDANTLPTANSAALSGDVTKIAGTNNTVLVTAQPAVHTWALTQTFTVAPVFTDASGSRTALGLGTAATVNTGTSGATIPLLNGTNTWSGTQAFGTSATISGVAVSAGQYPGETSTGNATAGNVGEYVEASVATGSAISVTDSTISSLTSVSLTAGDWDVTCHLEFNINSATNVFDLIGGISSANNTLAKTTGGKFAQNAYGGSPVAGGLASVTVGPTRISQASTASQFCNVSANFTANTITAWGLMRARRVR